MAMKDIQATIDKRVEEQATKDFDEAKKQARKLLAPFFEAVKFSDYRSDGELEHMQEEFAKTTHIGKYNDLYICNDMAVPGCYVRMKQAEAAKEFIEKVESLQEQIDDLYDRTER